MISCTHYRTLNNESKLVAPEEDCLLESTDPAMYSTVLGSTMHQADVLVPATWRDSAKQGAAKQRNATCHRTSL